MEEKLLHSSGNRFSNLKNKDFNFQDRHKTKQKMDHKFCVLFTLITLLTVTDYTEANNLVAYYSAAASTVLIAAAAVIFKVTLNCNSQLFNCSFLENRFRTSWADNVLGSTCST
jgi:hypothetical protein